MTTIYTLACRGSLNTKTAKCFGGGGWQSDIPDMRCPHCGKPMFLIQRTQVIDVRRPA